MEDGGYLLGRPENYDTSELDNTEAAKWSASDLRRTSICHLGALLFGLFSPSRLIDDYQPDGPEFHHRNLLRYPVYQASHTPSALSLWLAMTSKERAVCSFLR